MSAATLLWFRRSALAVAAISFLWVITGLTILVYTTDLRPTDSPWAENPVKGIPPSVRPLLVGAQTLQRVTDTPTRGPLLYGLTGLLSWVLYRWPRAHRHFLFRARLALVLLFCALYVVACLTLAWHEELLTAALASAPYTGPTIVHFMEGHDRVTWCLLALPILALLLLVSAARVTMPTFPPPAYSGRGWQRNS